MCVSLREQRQGRLLRLAPDLGQVVEPEVRGRADDQHVVDVECRDHRGDALAEHSSGGEDYLVHVVLAAVEGVDERLLVALSPALPCAQP